MLASAATARHTSGTLALYLASPRKVSTHGHSSCCDGAALARCTHEFPHVVCISCRMHQVGLGLGFGVVGLGFGVWGLGLGVWVLGFRV
jgi:hypothetical protein